MAGTITHQFIAFKLKEKYQELDSSYLLFSSSGPDIFNYLDKSLAKRMHQKETALFLKELIKKTDFNKKKELSILVGAFSHFIADSILHPYIYYLGGRYLSTKETEKYKYKHEIIETSIDNYFIDKFKYSFGFISSFKPFKTYLEVVNKVYGCHISLKDYKKAYLKRKIYYNLFRLNKGLKYYFYSSLLRKRLILDKRLKSEEYLNLGRNTWYHPVTKEKREESFLELIDQVLIRIEEGLDKIFKYYETHDESYLDFIENKSYLTGEIINKENKLVYFKE